MRRHLFRLGLGFALGLGLGALLVGTPVGAQVQLIPNIAGVLPGSLVWKSAQNTTFAPALDVAQEWNNAALAFTAIRLNVIDAASASGLLLDLQNGGVSQFQVSKLGNVVAAGTIKAASLILTGGTTTLGSITAQSVVCSQQTTPLAFLNGDFCGPIALAKSPGAPGPGVWIVRSHPLGNGNCQLVWQAGNSTTETVISTGPC